MDPRVREAVRNNAEWCDLVCRAHGIATRFDPDAWIAIGRTPMFYPDAVTLAPTPDDLLQRIDAGPGCSVKDSFAALDLGAVGFNLLFEAQWIHRAAGAFAATGAERVTSAAMLAAWAHAWGEAGAAGLFRPALLQAQDHAVIAAMRDGAIVGGCIATRSDGVLGISNLFAPAADDGSVRAACLDAAMRFAPAVPLVAYEHGVSLAHMQQLGFHEIGALRIWQAPR